jgi:hypothetical protein
MAVWENKREHVRYDESGLRTFPRQFSDAEMRRFDELVDRDPDLSPEKKHLVKRTLRRMQGLPYDETTIDPTVADVLRRLVREFA